MGGLRPVLCPEQKFREKTYKFQKFVNFVPR
jgi:hypothetical protein